MQGVLRRAMSGSPRDVTDRTAPTTHGMQATPRCPISPPISRSGGNTLIISSCPCCGGRRLWEFRLQHPADGPELFGTTKWTTSSIIPLKWSKRVGLGWFLAKGTPAKRLWTLTEVSTNDSRGFTSIARPSCPESNPRLPPAVSTPYFARDPYFTRSLRVGRSTK